MARGQVDAGTTAYLLAGESLGLFGRGTRYDGVFLILSSLLCTFHSSKLAPDLRYFSRPRRGIRRCHGFLLELYKSIFGRQLGVSIHRTVSADSLHLPSISNIPLTCAYSYLAPLVIGWGAARQKVYDLLLLLTCQALDEGKSDGADDEKPVRRTLHDA